MKKSLVTLFAIVLLVSFGTSASAQDLLKYFPEDHDIVLNIDLQQAIQMMPEAERQEMIMKSNKTLGFDISSRLNRVVVGMNMEDLQGGSPNFTGVFEANIVMQDILNAVAKEGKAMVKENIAGFEAYSAEEMEESGQKMYFAQAGANLFVIGNRQSLENFASVKNGQIPSAASNAALVTLVESMSTGSIFSMAGVFPEQMRTEMGQQMPMFGDITDLVINVGKVAEGVSYETLIGGTNDQSLMMMKGMIDQYIPMMRNNDQSGMAAEVLDNFNSEVIGNRLVIKGLLLQSTIDKLQKQFAPMMMGDEGYEEEENDVSEF